MAAKAAKLSITRSEVEWNITPKQNATPGTLQTAIYSILNHHCFRQKMTIKQEKYHRQCRPFCRHVDVDVFGDFTNNFQNTMKEHII